MESSKDIKREYPYEEIIRLEIPKTLGSTRTVSSAQLKNTLKKDGTQNAHLASYYRDQFVFYVPKEDEAKIAQQLLRDNNGVTGATTIKGEGREFFAGYETDEIQPSYLKEIENKIKQKRAQLNKAKSSVEDTRLEIQNYQQQLKTYYQVKQRLDKVFTPKQATEILEAYSQLPGYFIIRTVINAIKPTPPETIPTLVISEIRPEDRDIALIEENGRVYLDVTYRNVSIEDTKTGNKVGVFPLSSSARFELKKVKGRMAFEFSSATIGNPDVLDMMAGRMLDEAKLREKYCSPEYEFHALWKKLNNELNDESREARIRELGARVADSIKNLVALLKELDETKSQYRKDLEPFSALLNEIIQAIKNPTIDSHLEYRILNIQIKIEHLMRSQIVAHHPRYRHSVEATSQYKDLFVELDLALNAFVEQKPISSITRSLSKIKSTTVANSISTRLSMLEKLNQKTISERSNQELENDLALKPLVAPSSSTKILKVEEIQNLHPEADLMVRMQGHDWINHSTDPTPESFYRDAVISEGRLFFNQESLTPTEDLATQQRQELLINGLMKELRLSHEEATELFEHLSEVYHQGMYSTLKVTLDSIGTNYIETYQSSSEAKIRAEIKSLTEYKKGLQSLKSELTKAGSEPLDKTMLKHSSLAAFAQVLPKKPIEDVTNRELSTLTKNELSGVEDLIKSRENDLKFDFLTNITTTANMTKSADGNIHLDVIFSDIVISTTAKQPSLLHVPGVLSLRYLLTPDGFKLESMKASNSLLMDIMMKNGKETAKNIINKLPSAQQDEDLNHHRAIAYSNIHIRHIWAEIEKSYALLPSEARLNNNKFNALKELTTQILADPFNPTLGLAYQNFIRELKTDSLEESREIYTKIEHDMRLLVQEAQIEEEKKTLDKIAKLSSTLQTNANEDNVKEFLNLINYVATFPESQDLVEAMQTQLQEQHPVILQHIKLKQIIQSQRPSGEHNYLADYLLKEGVYRLKVESNAYTHDLSWLVTSKEKYKHPLFEELNTQFAEAVKRNNLATWFDTVMLVAMDDLFDQKGNVRQDIAAILSFPNKTKTEYSEQEKAELLRTYINHFIISSLNKKFESANPRIEAALAGLATRVDQIAAFDQSKMNTLELSLLDKVDYSNPKPLKDFIINYTYRRNHYALSRTLSDRNCNPDVGVIGNAILDETDRMKEIKYDVSVSALTRNLIIINKAIKEPNQSENWENLVKSSEKVGKRSTGRVVGGLMLALAGALLALGSIVAIPATKFIATPIAVKGFITGKTLLMMGLAIAGIVGATIAVKAAPKVQDEKQHGFFNRLRFRPIKRHMEELEKIARPKPSNN